MRTKKHNKISYKIEDIRHKVETLGDATNTTRLAYEHHNQISRLFNMATSEQHQEKRKTK